VDAALKDEGDVTTCRVRGQTCGGESPRHTAHAHGATLPASGSLATDRGPERKGVRRSGNGLSKNTSTQVGTKSASTFLNCHVCAEDVAGCGERDGDYRWSVRDRRCSPSVSPVSTRGGASCAMRAVKCVSRVGPRCRHWYCQTSWQHGSAQKCRQMSV